MSARVIEVVVRGRLGPTLAGALEGFSVDTDAAGLTHVIGTVADQPGLLGLLDLFGDLNIEVVSVNPANGSR